MSSILQCTFISFTALPLGKLSDTTQHIASEHQETIQKSPKPLTIKHMTFFGLATCSHEWIAYYAYKTKPLCNLVKSATQSERRWLQWNEEAVTMFPELKLKCANFYSPDSSKPFHRYVAEHASMLQRAYCCVCDHHGPLGHIAWESCPASTVHTSKFFDHNCSLDWLHMILSAPDLTTVYCHSINPTKCLVLPTESQPQNCVVFPKKYLQSLRWLVCWPHAMLTVSHSLWVVHAVIHTHDWLLVMLSFHSLLTMKHLGTSSVHCVLYMCIVIHICSWCLSFECCNLAS